MSFDEWYSRKYLGENMGFERHIREAWNAAIDEAVKIAISSYSRKDVNLKLSNKLLELKDN